MYEHLLKKTKEEEEKKKKNESKIRKEANQDIEHRK